MIKVYDAADIIDAQRASDQLAAGGIQSKVNGGYLTGGIGELGVSNLFSVWIYEPMHYDLARELLQALDDNLQKVSEKVYCPKCQELIEGHFSRCWHCNNPLDNSI